MTFEEEFPTFEEAFPFSELGEKDRRRIISSFPFLEKFLPPFHERREPPEDLPEEINRQIFFYRGAEADIQKIRHVQCGACSWFSAQGIHRGGFGHLYVYAVAGGEIVDRHRLWGHEAVLDNWRWWGEDIGDFLRRLRAAGVRPEYILIQRCRASWYTVFELEPHEIRVRERVWLGLFSAEAES